MLCKYELPFVAKWRGVPNTFPSLFPCFRESRISVCFLGSPKSSGDSNKFIKVCYNRHLDAIQTNAIDHPVL